MDRHKQPTVIGIEHKEDNSTKEQKWTISEQLRLYRRQPMKLVPDQSVHQLIGGISKSKEHMGLRRYKTIK